MSLGLCLAALACGGGGSKKGDGGQDMPVKLDVRTVMGAERGPCYPNKTCNAGLVCLSGVCVRLPDQGVPDRGLPDLNLAPSKEGGVYLDGAVVKPGRTTCLDASVEPNNSGSTATPLSVTGLITGWEICYPGDVDQYAITLPAGETLTVKVSFVHSKGDLDAAIVAPDGTITAGRSTTNNETVAVSNTTTSPARTILGVWGFGDATNAYDLEISLTH